MNNWMPKTAAEVSKLDLLWKHASAGVQHGYPACCIREFLEDYQAGRAAGVERLAKTGYVQHTGFVPCEYHCLLALTAGGPGSLMKTAKEQVSTQPPKTGDEVVVQLEKGRGYSIVAMGFVPSTKNPADGDPFDVILADKKGGQGGRFRAKVIGVIRDPKGNHKWIATTDGKLPGKDALKSLRGYRAARQEFIGKKMPIKIPGVEDKQVKCATELDGLVAAACSNCGYETQPHSDWQTLAGTVRKDGGTVDYESPSFAAGCPGCGMLLDVNGTPPWPILSSTPSMEL